MAREVKELLSKPEDGIRVRGGWGRRARGAMPRARGLHPPRPLFSQVLVNEDNVADIQVEYDGPGMRGGRREGGGRGHARSRRPRPPSTPPPAGTPYEGGTYRMRVTLPPDFPASPPACAFATKLFHPNVSTAGAVCVNVLKKDWAPALGLRHVLVVVRCLLIEPFAESALNEEAGRLLLEDYAAFASRAALMASVHAGAGKGGSGAAAPPSALSLTMPRYRTRELCGMVSMSTSFRHGTWREGGGGGASG